MTLKLYHFWKKYRSGNKPATGGWRLYPPDQARRHGGHFRAVPSQIINACAPKERNRPGATSVHFGACAPQKNCLFLLSVSKISFQDEKYECTPKLSLRFRAEDVLFFLVFTPEFVDQKRDPYH